MSESNQESNSDVLTPIWASMLSTSLKQTLILSYLNKKFPGSIEDMTQEFGILKGMLNIQPEVQEDVSKVLTGMPKTNTDNDPFRIISNEILSDTIIQTLLIRYFVKTNPNIAVEMLNDFKLISGDLKLNDVVNSRVTSFLTDFLPDKK